MRPVIQTICRAPLALALIACASLLLACSPAPDASAAAPLDDSSAANPTPTPTATPSPTPEPTPALALDPQQIWVAPDAGAVQAVASIAADGTLTAVSLPLDDGQTAGSLTADPHGTTLAYLLWGADGSQQGIAVWPLAEPDDRLLVETPAGARIIALALSGDGREVAYVEVREDGVPLADADWALKLASLEGGESCVLTSRGALENALPLVPFAWVAGGPILLAPAALRDEPASVYAVDPATGHARRLFEAETPMVGEPRLSPSGARLAYAVAELDVAAHVYDLRLSRTTAVETPDGMAALSLRWHPDGEHLLLDLTAPSPADDGRTAQLWALVPVDGEEGERVSSAQVREGLFDYAPFGDGVVYTTTQSEDACTITIKPDIVSETEYSISLDALAQPGCAPFLIHVP